MSIPVNINGVIIPYPQTGDTGWGDDATKFAVEVASVLGKIGQSQAPVNDDIIVSPGNLSITSGNFSVGGNASVTGNTTLTGILNVDSGVLYVDPTNNRVGINDTTPSEALDVIGNALINGTLNVSGNTTVDGVTYLDDDMTANTPVISFTGDTNTGIGRSAADTLDFITNGNSRFRIESTGQIKAVYESQVGTDYNTQLDNGYLCRAWVNFNGTGTVAIRASGNVSSITDNGTGNYTVNFTTAMPDANYSVVGMGNGSSGNYNIIAIRSYNANGVSLYTGSGHEPGLSAGTPFDESNVLIAVFR